MPDDLPVRGRRRRSASVPSSLAADDDRLAAQRGERAAAGAVEVELPVEEHERRLDGEPVLEDLAGGKRQEAVRVVAAADVEPDQPAEGAVEQRVDRDAEPHVPMTTGRPTSEPVRRRAPHPAEHALAAGATRNAAQ